MTMSNEEFIQAVAGYVQKYASSYGIMVHSPIIAQAILESGWGKSTLASKYHNYFGLKCGSSWTGKSVNMTTQEEYTEGTLTTIKDNFRVYDSMEEGIKGYFEFIQYSRYANLKGITDPKEYLETIKADGYATSSTYVTNTYALVTQYNLTQYDGKGSVEEMANAVVKQAQAWIGCKESDGSHKQIIDVYNSHTPLARGYKVQYTDAWCATFVSACAIKAGCTDVLPTECGCDRMIDLFKNLGEWVENDAYVPSAGDVIFYDWDDSGSGDNTGSSDHVGIVESCDGKNIVVIEGNKNDAVEKRTIAVNGKFIRGFGVPKYSGTSNTTSTATKSVAEVAQEVIQGLWGNGDDRKTNLTNAGYDYSAVQKKVNELLSGTSTTTTTTSKSVDEIAQEVINGKWGNGDDRKKALTNAGYDYDAVQAKVNSLLSGSSSTTKSVTEIAKEVIQGKWGNGTARKEALEKAGYNYSEVQKKVNELMS
jgi:hypothetical protein